MIGSVSNGYSTGAWYIEIVLSLCDGVMVRTNGGSVVAAAVAVLEQQSAHGVGGLRRAGAVSVLPRRNSSSTTDSEAEAETKCPGQYRSHSPT